MDENDLSIEKREPGFFASLFGAEPETVLVNNDGDVVGKIETEEPGFLGSLLGEEAKQVIVSEDGEKVATFETEQPGFFTSLMGEKEKTSLVDESGETLASFDKEEPGLLGSLLGEKTKNILVDNTGNKLATFDKEEPGLIGKLLGDKPKRLIRGESERADEIRRTLSRKKADENSNQDNEPVTDYDDDDDYQESSASLQDEGETDEVYGKGFRIGPKGSIYINFDEVEDGQGEPEFLRDGRVRLQEVHRTSTGFTITTTTYDSRADYERSQRILAMVKERLAMDENEEA